MPTLDWLSILSTTTVISTVLQFLTGTLVCHKYIQKKSTGDSSGFPFICGFLSCSLWLKYGFLTNENSVILVNIAGTGLMFGYTIIYCIFTVNKTTVIRQFASVLIILMSVIAYTEYEKDVSKSIPIIGLICCSVTVMFFASPLTMLLHVIRVKNPESLPYPMILSSFFVCLQWFIYGIVIGDMFIQIPNFLGCVLTAAQLSLFVIYSSKNTPGPTYKLLDQTIAF